MKWHEFLTSAPRIGALANEAFNDDHLAILGTLRSNGWPRISPCEVYFVDGEMLFGMMVESTKALDLRRDPRITVVNGQEHREPKHGDVKLYGTAREITSDQQALRERFADAQEAEIDWRPPAEFPLFAMDIESASYISFGDEHTLLRWSAESGEEQLRHPDEG
jgi:nitroimidazol reductase NimA-like FMN-containing flavoprotein (pyridoxamine 5'-phosphate oxidase superfamily)